MLSWMLWGISKEETLQSHLVFKAGPCLKKCYSEDYRFLQDLDFSVVKGCSSGETLETLIHKTTKKSKGSLSEKGFKNKAHDFYRISQ